MSKIFYLTFALGIFAFASCQEEDFGYKSYEPDKAETDYSLRFANRDAVKVNITTETPGAPYYVYFENPIGEDGLHNGATAYLKANTPVETTLSVPRHVEKLYVATPNREVRELPVGDININDKDYLCPVAQTRVNTNAAPYLVPESARFCIYRDPNYAYNATANPDVNQSVLNFVHNCFPSGTGESFVKPEYKEVNTDLVVPTSDTTEYTAVWITWLGMGTGDQECAVWFYVYPTGATDSYFGNKTEMWMYGRQFSDSIDVNKGKPNRESCLFDSKKNKVGDVVFVGYIKSGYSIGFMYQCYGTNGQQAKVRYTTPQQNKDVVGGDKTPQTGGFAINHTIDDHEYNFIGIERDTWKINGNTIESDHDFNDALLCVETSLPVKPYTPIPDDPREDEYITKGYYLFEDLNGAASGNDNDFNDVVVYYEKILYSKKEQTAADGTHTLKWWCDFNVDLLANACQNTNAIGLYIKKTGEDTPFTTLLIENIQGLDNNMEIAPAYNGSTMVKRVHYSLNSKNDVILPFLRSVPKGETYKYDPTSPQATSYDANRYNIYCTTYATSGFPYAIEVPFVQNNPFRWTKEGVKITNAYSNWNSKDWYTAPSDASAVVPRAEGTTKY